MSYEYFASSLPDLRFGEKPPMTPEEFAASAAGVLSDADCTALGALLSGDWSDHPFVVRWRDRETQLRNAVARRRAARLEASGRGGVDDSRAADRPHGGWSADVEAGVDAAFQEPDPLARHRALARLRWDQALEIAGTDPFSSSAVLAWAVRLLVDADLASFDAGKGMAKLDAASSGGARG